MNLFFFYITQRIVSSARFINDIYRVENRNMERTDSDSVLYVSISSTSRNWSAGRTWCSTGDLRFSRSCVLFGDSIVWVAKMPGEGRRRWEM